MSMVLSIYTKDAFKEFLLPSLNNADYTITFYRDYFHLQEDIQLRLEILDGIWRIQPDTHYQVIKDQGQHRENYKGKQLRDGDILRLQTNFMENMSVIVKDTASGFHVYKKYKLDGVNEITIGKKPENDIVYNYQSMVSGNHARIVKTARGYEILNNSPNGIYVNSLRVDNKADLEFGTFINIIGLHLV